MIAVRQLRNSSQVSASHIMKHLKRQVFERIILKKNINHAHARAQHVSTLSSRPSMTYAREQVLADILKKRARC